MAYECAQPRRAKAWQQWANKDSGNKDSRNNGLGLLQQFAISAKRSVRCAHEMVVEWQQGQSNNNLGFLHKFATSASRAPRQVAQDIEKLRFAL